MSHKAATARIKINKLLEAGGWRFFQTGDAPANIRLEPKAEDKNPLIGKEQARKYARSQNLRIPQPGQATSPASHSAASVMRMPDRYSSCRRSRTS